MIEHSIRMAQYKIANLAQHYLASNIEAGTKLRGIAKKYDLDQGEVYKTFATTVGDIILGFYKIEDTVPLLQQELGLDPRTAALLGADVLDFLSPLSDPNWQPPVEEGVEDEEDMEKGGISEYVVEDDMEDYSAVENIGNPLPITNNQPNKVPPVTYDVIPATNPVQHLTSVPPISRDSQPQPAPQNQFSNQSIPANPALHTMASDMEIARQAPTLNLEDAPTYVAQNQDSLRKPLSNTPTYTPAPQPTTPPSASNIEPPRWSDN